MRKHCIIAIFLVCAASPALATLAEPEHVFFGFVRDGATVITTGTVTVRINGDSVDAASYVLGSIGVFGQRYVLRVPLSSLLPRVPGTAQSGDQAAFFVDGKLAGAASVGDRGTPQQVDLDVNFAGVPVLSVADFSLPEGDAGTSNASIVVSLAFATNRDVTFNFATANGTATAGSDYVAATGSGTIATGQTTATVLVTVNGDTAPEASETFLLNVSGVLGATAGDVQALVTILDDDTSPTASIADATVIESDTDNKTLQFVVTLSNVRANAVTIDYSTTSGTATEGADFTAASGTLSIPAGSLTGTIDVTVLPDNLIEPDETLVLTLSNASGAVISNATATGTIVDDDRVLTMIEVQKDGVASVTGLSGVSSLAISPRGEHLYAAGQGSNRVVVFARNQVTGRLTFVESAVGVTTPRTVAVSPDGKHLYAGSSVDASISAFSRNETTGRLTFIEVQRNNIAGVLGLGGLNAVTLSADGASLYAASGGDDSVVAFARDAATGRLSFVEVEFDGVAGVNGLDGASSVSVSSDGTHVYVAGSVDSAVALFTRDPATSRLTFSQGGPVLGLSGLGSVTVTADGKHVIAGAQLDDAIGVFGRNLSLLSTYTNLLNGVEGLNGVVAVGAARDGRFVYTAANEDSAIAVFGRDPATGALTFREVERDGVRGVDGLAGAAAVAISPDSRFIYGAGSSEAAVAVLEVTDVGSRADPNGDGVMTIGDIFYLVNFIFSGGPPPVGRGDMNGDANVTVGDIFYLVNHFFAGGPPPP